MVKINIGIASYGSQPPEWWQQMAFMLSGLHQYGISIGSLHVANSMHTAGNRNIVVKAFLQTISEWLLWIDTDNIIPIGGIKRLLDTQKVLVCGLYYQKSDGYKPVAYKRLPNNRYRPIEKWNRGELLPIDMAGMGATLVHRSVYEEIEKQFMIVQRWSGGISLIHKDDIEGELPEDFGKVSPRMVGGTYQESMVKPDHKQDYFPHYIMEYGRTEDVVFFENAKRVGVQPFVDTSVEVTHITVRQITGVDYRKELRVSKQTIPAITEYVDASLLEVGE